MYDYHILLSEIMEHMRTQFGFNLFSLRQLQEVQFRVLCWYKFIAVLLLGFVLLVNQSFCNSSSINTIGDGVQENRMYVKYSNHNRTDLMNHWHSLFCLSLFYITVLQQNNGTLPKNHIFLLSRRAQAFIHGQYIHN